MQYTALRKDLYVNRDACTANDVAKMAELGRFGEEIIVYGTAVKEHNDKIYYYVTSNEKFLFNMIESKRRENLYFTPVVSIMQRMQVPAGGKESVMLAFKYSLLSKMKTEYESVNYFDLMHPLFSKKENNNAYTILNRYRKHIEGNFDDSELQKFMGLLQTAYDSKVLSLDGYNELIQWHKLIRRQMEDDPIIEDNIERTLYGFVYWKNNSSHCIFDAREVSVLKKRQELILKGYFPGPILKKTYWFKNFNQFTEIKNEHQQWLLDCENKEYFNILAEIKQVKGVINFQELLTIKASVANSIYATNAVEYFEFLWNKE